VAEQLAAGQHVVLFYTTEEQHRSVVTAFLRRGLQRGTRTLYVSRAHEPDTILAYLREDGADVEGALSRRQLQVVRWGQLPSGDPSAEKAPIAADIATLAEEAVAEGFSGLWLSVEWTGSTNGQPNGDWLLQQEARIGECVRQTPTTVLCQFDCRQAAPHALIQALRVHPHVMVGLTAHENSYALTPERCLRGNGPLGDSPFTQKPFAPGALAERVRQLLDQGK
jgi:hypothetical protein